MQAIMHNTTPICHARADNPCADYTSGAWNRCKEEALARAADLRREAMNEFWRDTTHWVRLGVGRIGRTTMRLQQWRVSHRQHRQFLQAK